MLLGGLAVGSHVKAQNADSPRGGLEQAGDAADRGRLARPVGAQEAEDLPRLGGEADPIDGHQVAVFLLQSVDFDHGFVLRGQSLGDWASRGNKRQALVGIRVPHTDLDDGNRIGVRRLFGKGTDRLILDGENALRCKAGGFDAPSDRGGARRGCCVSRPRRPHQRESDRRAGVCRVPANRGVERQRPCGLARRRGVRPHSH